MKRSVAVILAGLAIFSVSITADQQRSYFERPVRKIGADRRITPNPAWITTKWNAAADKPFLSLERELAAYKTFRGFEDGKWVNRAVGAVHEWRIDHQNAVKLFKACAYVGIAGEVDREFAKRTDLQKISTDLNHAWEIIENPPSSYIFVRMGYRWNAGDGDKHDYASLARALLKRDPLDRAVAKAAVGELWDESLLGSKPQADLIQFEKFILNALNRVRKSDRWRPWDDRAIASVYHTRALRTSKRSDMQKAINYTRIAISKCPAGFDTSYLKKNLAMYQERMAMMKFD